MSEIKHYGAADLYDPQGMAGDEVANSKSDAVALGKNVRAWMRNRLRSKNQTTSTTVLAEHTPTELSNSSDANKPGVIMSKPTSNESMATLLSIPGEIRNTIYHLCLFPLSPSLLGLHFSHPKDVFYTLLRSPLFRTCRQIRAEVLSFLAATKDFRLPGIRTATTFLRYIGPIGRANLSHMTIALLSEQDVDVDGGKELVRFMRDIKGVGRRRVVVGIQTTVNMQDGVIGFLTALRESLEEGCEDMHVSWCLLENGLPAKASPQEVARNQTIAGLERALGKENMIKGTMWTLVDARRV